MNTETQYKNGFNSGYLLKKYQSELCELITKNISATGVFWEGLFEGKELVENEQKKDQLYNLRLYRLNGKDVDKER